MKIETLKKTPKKLGDGSADLLRKVQPGQMIRVNTAQQYRSIWGLISRIQKERSVKFSSANDGETDVLIFIKESPKNV